MSVLTASSQGIAERQEVVTLARDLGRRELAPLAQELDQPGARALEVVWGQIAEVGFDRALLPVADGGVGLDPGSLLLCLEEIAAGDAGVAMLVLLSNAALAALPPERAAQIGEGERWALVPVPGKRLATASRIEVSANGRKPPAVTGTLCPALGALGADGVVLLAREAEPAVLALPAGMQGVQFGTCDSLLGLRAAAPARLAFSEARVGPATLTAEAQGVVDSSLALLRAGVAAIARGVGRRAFELAAEYAHVRVQGGVPLVRHDAVRDMLVAMAVRLRSPKTIEIDDGAALVAKITASDDAAAIATDAVQVFGGTGYMRETGVEKLMRDAKILQLWPESNWIAREQFVGVLHPPAD